MKPLVLLAPSEEKASGGHTGRLMENPAQKWVREKLIELVVHGGPEAWAKAFAVKNGALAKACQEALALRHPVPLAAALERYQGVAFVALDAASLPRATWRQVFILSNLRGLVRGDEPVPPYKLKLGGIPGLKAYWRKHLGPSLASIPKGPLWELLPEEHSELLKDWARPRHTLEITNEEGKSVSHFSKLYRGRVARWLLLHGQGAPAKVIEAKIEGCSWAGIEENSTGGTMMRLVVLQGARP
ncbi:MAG: peroxide stress protein YaaA [Acidobacteriota bacterium]|nr:peroxide stress protein YaaA [Acidobacteriota bacterium]